MNEDFAPFELAKKLKEKGFREKVNAYYGKHENIFEIHPALDMNDADYGASAPTISQVLKWLREEQGYNVNMRIYSPDGWYWTIQDRDGNYCCYHLTLSDDLFETYEQAALAGVNYCLENLI